jgi:hypothetical protein
LKDVTRKMMATIAELSMLQATAIKLQQEREEIEHVVDEARERTSKSMPPTPETEVEYLKMQRDKKRYEEARELRVQREAFEKSLPPFVTKTTAENRVNAYIPDEIGIPKPYGLWAPFKPSDIGVQIRHFRKPVQKYTPHTSSFLTKFVGISKFKRPNGVSRRLILILRC